jgi:hypothetical protein
MMIHLDSKQHRDSSRLSALRMTYFLCHPELVEGLRVLFRYYASFTVDRVIATNTLGF